MGRAPPSSSSGVFLVRRKELGAGNAPRKCFAVIIVSVYLKKDKHVLTPVRRCVGAAPGTGTAKGIEVKLKTWPLWLIDKVLGNAEGNSRELYAELFSSLCVLY